MSITIACLTMKGGVGKTTTVAHLGHALARKGARVLIVDLDAQANLTLWLRPDIGPPADLATALRTPARWAEAIAPSTAAGVDLLHGSHETAGIIGELQASRTPVTALRRLLRPIVSYDYILLDGAPGLDLLALNAIVAADHVIVPVETHAMALSGLTLLKKTIQDLIDDELLTTAPPLRALATKHDGRTSLAKDVLAYLKDDPGTNLFTTIIAINSRLAECYAHRKTIFDVDPTARGARDYIALATEIHAYAAA